MYVPGVPARVGVDPEARSGERSARLVHLMDEDRTGLALVDDRDLACCACNHADAARIGHAVARRRIGLHQDNPSGLKPDEFQCAIVKIASAGENSPVCPPPGSS